MKAIILATTMLTSMSAWAAAQDFGGDRLWERASSTRVAASREFDAGAYSLPTSLSAEPLFEDAPASFSIGPVGGYLNVRGADSGTWFGGVQARLHFAKFFAAEASITFHSNQYEDGDVVVTQYPVQLTAFFYIIPEGPIRPYILGGVGWYYTRYDYQDNFEVLYDDRTESIFGVHLGAGAEVMLGSRASLNMDVRYIFLNADTDAVIDRDYNYWQLTAGLNFYF